MKTITLTVDPKDLSRYGLEENSKMEFSDLVDRINRDFALQALQKAQTIAEQTDLSNLSEEEINQEIKAIRDESNS